MFQKSNERNSAKISIVRLFILYVIGRCLHASQVSMRIFAEYILPHYIRIFLDGNCHNCFMYLLDSQFDNRVSIREWVAVFDDSGEYKYSPKSSFNLKNLKLLN